MDQFESVEQLARAFASQLEEDFDSIEINRQDALRRIAFTLRESLLREQSDTLEMASQSLMELLAEPSTPKRWQAGLKEGSAALRTVKRQLEEGRRIEIPDHLSSYLATPDPYAYIEAGEDDPYYDEVELACGVAGDGGWTCTRTPHPSHWQHWDSDWDYADGDGIVLVTWMGDGGELTSVSQVVIENGDCDFF